MEPFFNVGLLLWYARDDIGGTDIDSGNSIGYGLGTDLNLYNNRETMMRVEYYNYDFNDVYLESSGVLRIGIVVRM